MATEQSTSELRETLASAVDRAERAVENGGAVAADFRDVTVQLETVRRSLLAPALAQEPVPPPRRGVGGFRLCSKAAIRRIPLDRSTRVDLSTAG